MDKKIWAVAILFFGIGDLVTTFIGFNTAGVIEVHPLFVGYHFTGVVIVKTVVIFLFYKAYTWIMPPANLGIPVGLSLLGAAVTIWNSVIILEAIL